MIHVGGTRLFSTVVRSRHVLSGTFLHFSGSRSLNLHTGSMLRNRRDGVRWARSRCHRGAKCITCEFWAFVGSTWHSVPTNSIQQNAELEAKAKVTCVVRWRVGFHGAMTPLASKKLYMLGNMTGATGAFAVTWLKVMRPFVRHAPCIYIDIRK